MPIEGACFDLTLRCDGPHLLPKRDSFVGPTFGDCRGQAKKAGWSEHPFTNWKSSESKTYCPACTKKGIQYEEVKT
jgi:hypothetical protein